MAQLTAVRSQAITPTHFAPLTTSSAAALRQTFAGNVAAAPALEELKRTADRMMQEAQNTKQNTEQYRQKLQAAQEHSKHLEATLAKERQQIAKLTTKIKDDQKQITVVNTTLTGMKSLQESLLVNLSMLQLEVDTGKQRCSQLSMAFDKKLADYERIVQQADELNECKKHLEQQMSQDQHKIKTLTDNGAALLASLKQAEKAAAAVQAALEQVEANSAARIGTLEQNVSQLTSELCSAKEMVTKLQTEVEAASAKQLSDAQAHHELKNDLAQLQSTLHETSAAHEATSNELAAKQAALEASALQYKELVDIHSNDQLQLAGLKADLERTLAALSSETTWKEDLLQSRQQLDTELDELRNTLLRQEDLATQEKIVLDQKVYQRSIELESSKKETAELEAKMATAVKQAKVEGERSLAKFTEQTVKAFDEQKAKAKTEIEAERQQAKAQLDAITNEKATLTQELAAMSVQVKKNDDDRNQLAKQHETELLNLTKKYLAELEAEKNLRVEQEMLSKKQIADARAEYDQEIALLKGKHTTVVVEMATLSTKYEDLQMESKAHGTVKEQLLKDHAHSLDTLTKSLRQEMDDKISQLNAKLVAQQDLAERLAATEADLESVTASLATAHEQISSKDALLQEVQMALQHKSAILQTISMAAGSTPKDHGNDAPAIETKAAAAKAFTRGKPKKPSVDTSLLLASSQPAATAHGKLHKSSPPHFKQAAKQTGPHERPAKVVCELAEGTEKTIKVHKSNSKRKRQAEKDNKKADAKIRKAVAAALAANGRRSIFSTMSAQAVTEDEEEDDDDVVSHDSRGERQQTAAGGLAGKRACGKKVTDRAHKRKKSKISREDEEGSEEQYDDDGHHSAAYDLFGGASLDPYNFEQSSD